MRKIKLTLNLMILSLFSSLYTYASMLPEADGNIIINNSKKPMADHIRNILFYEPDSPFKNTHIVTYNENFFKVVGKVTQCPEKYKKLIDDNVYTYIPYYKTEKVNWDYEDFGAILVGHKNKDLADRLYFADVKHSP